MGMIEDRKMRVHWYYDTVALHHCRIRMAEQQLEPSIT